MNHPFVWAVGIENTSLPEWNVDQLQLAGHADRWQADLQLARDLGVTHIRHGLPWATLNPAPDEYDWSWSDQVIEALQELQLVPIWDLVHFGAPLWLEGGFLHPEYPAAIAAFGRAFASRYPSVQHYTPFNEPYICAFFRAGNGTWPPHGTTTGGFVQMLVPIIEGIRQTTEAIGQVRPEARFWLNDGADGFRASSPELQNLAQELSQQRFIPLDVLLGHATPDSPTGLYLLQHGVSAAWLQSFADRPVQIDVVGLDYYPGSEHLISPPTGPKPAGDWGRREDYHLHMDPHPLGLGETLRLYHERYGKPVYVAETSSDHHQMEWLKYSISEVARVQDLGVNVVGYTWWPLFDHIDWNSGLTQRAGHVCPSGIYHLTPTPEHRTPGRIQQVFSTLTRTVPQDYGTRDFVGFKGVNT